MTVASRHAGHGGSEAHRDKFRAIIAGPGPGPRATGRRQCQWLGPSRCPDLNFDSESVQTVTRTPEEPPPRLPVPPA